MIVQGEGRATPVIRAAVAEDLDRIVAIERSCFSDPWTTDAFASAIALTHSRFLVAEEHGTEPAGEDDAAARRRGDVPRLLGYVVALVVADEGEIADLAVAPAARRRGIGGALLDRVTAAALQAGVHALYLEVRESNVAALALYRSRGFAPVGRRQAYYRDPVEDALLLRRDLGPA
jgi:ribosomal-protein-alanine N-acetyltransferase